MAIEGQEFEIDPKFITKDYDITEKFDPSRETITEQTLKKVEEGKDIFSAEKEAYKEETKRAVDTKLDYIQDVTGFQIANESLDFDLNDLELGFLLGRDEEYETRRKRFLSFFPEGDFKRVAIPKGPDDVEFIELFKKNQNEEKFKMFEPVGKELNVGDAEIAGQILNAQLLGEVAFVIATKGQAAGKSLLTKILTSKPAQIYLGNITGQQIDELIDTLTGYGEGPFAKFGEMLEKGEADPLDLIATGTEAFKNNFFNKQTQIEAASSAAMFTFIDMAGQILSGAMRPGLVPEADAIAMGAKEFDLPPLRVGQLINQPLLRQSWYQTKEFVNFPREIIDQQLEAAKNNLLKLSEGQPLTLEIIEQTQADLEKILGAKVIDLLGANKATVSDLNKQVDEASKKWSQSSQEAVDGKINLAFEGYVGGGGIKGISGLKTSGNRFIDTYEAGVKGKKTVVPNEKGELVEVDSKIITGNVNDPDFIKFKSAMSKINDLPSILNFADKAEGKKYVDGLINLRKEFFDLSIDAKDQAVADQARRMHQLISNRFDEEFVFGNTGLKFFMGATGKQIDADEAVLATEAFRKIILDKDANIFDAVKSFIRPDSPMRVEAIQEMLKAGNKEVENAGETLFNVVRRFWLDDMVSNPGAIKSKINQWRELDPEGLDLLLGPNTKVDDLYEIANFQSKINSGKFKKMLDNQGEVYELINETITRAKGKTIGTSAAIDDMIEMYGGGDMYSPFMVSARAGIIENMFKKATEFSKDTKVEYLNASKMINEIKDLRNNPNLVKFFDDGALENLEFLQQYYTTLSESADVGAAFQRGEMGANLIDGLFNPAKLASIGFKLLRRDIFSRLLAGKVTDKELMKELANSDLIGENTAILVKGLLTEATKDITMDEGKEEGGPNTSVEFTVDRDVRVIPPDLSAQQVPVEVPTTAVPGSAVSSAQVVAPLPTMGGQPQQTNVARAQQAFPFDPIFAAADGGIADKGIMNTSRGRQMVV